MLNNNILLISILGLLVISGCGQKKPDDAQENGPRGRTLEYVRKVSFINNEDTVATIDVALADDNSERNTGLMDVNNLPKNKGMLFIFESDEPRSFWMANTPLSLDIIFANSDYEIVRIHHTTQPFAEKNFLSGEPAKYVIETNGGFCVSHDIQEGMKIVILNPQ